MPGARCRVLLDTMSIFLSKRMKRISILLLIGLTSPLLNVRAAQDSKFNVGQLSKDGRKAYEELLNVRLFAIGPVGWGAQTSEAELALHVLLTEKVAYGALKSLVNVASPEGRLYGLIGLHLIDISAFNEEVEHYKSRPESFEGRSTLPGRLDFNTTLKGEVRTARGCIVWDKPLRDIVSAIQAGEYDREFQITRVNNWRSMTKW